ncbi:flavodoxin family protein [Acetobacterium sp.]|uniref:flavodoxin family protein n=1 Tax=Acetobacterium sp. TaxID=1872094 RepID=UPI0035948303
MSTKIIGVSGSPINNSNTDRLLKHVLESSGLEYEIFKLSEMDIKPCKACKACVNDNICKVNDDFPSVAEKIKLADGLVIAAYTPYSMIDGHTKALLERFFSFRHQNSLLQEKYLVTIVSSMLDISRQATHQSIVFEAVAERMNHVRALDIAGAPPCNTCGVGDECINSNVKLIYGPEAVACAENFIPVEEQPVWNEGELVGKQLGDLINKKENYVPSDMTQTIMKLLENFM